MIFCQHLSALQDLFWFSILLFFFSLDIWVYSNVVSTPISCHDMHLQRHCTIGLIHFTWNRKHHINTCNNTFNILEQMWPCNCLWKKLKIYTYIVFLTKLPVLISAQQWIEACIEGRIDEGNLHHYLYHAFIIKYIHIFYKYFISKLWKSSHSHKKC